MMNLSKQLITVLISKSIRWSSRSTLATTSCHFSDDVTKDPRGASQHELEKSNDQAQRDRQPVRLEHKPSQVELYRVPDDETVDIPKKHVFQALTRRRISESVYTIEEAARFVPMDMQFKAYKYPYIATLTGSYEYCARSYMNEHSLVFQWPDITDILIIGGGLIGSATAYYIKKIASHIDVVVVDKNPYSTNNCTAFSNGLISVQSKSQDITRIANLSKELIRDLKNDVVVTPEDYAQIHYQPCSHVVLWPEETLVPDELESMYPWLRIKGTKAVMGTVSNQDEAIIDPIGLRNLYRTLAHAHGCNFLQAEAIDFNPTTDIRSDTFEPTSCASLIARIGTGELKQLNFAYSLLCLGHNTPFLESKVEMDPHKRQYIEDLHIIQPKLRIYFTFTSEMAPVINFPVITETDGSQLLRIDHTGTFKYYLTLEESSKFFDDDSEKYMNLDSDDPFPNLFHTSQLFADYFKDVVKKRLVERVPLMEDAQFIHAASGFESYNTFDGSPIMSMHPQQQRLMISGGYGNRLMTYGPLAAYSYAELILLREEELFDITNFYWDRVMKNKPVQEFYKFIA